MLKHTFPALCVLAGSMLTAVPALAQFAPPGLPSPELIKNADNYDPPRLTEYATKLAQQPDMTGLWTVLMAPNTGFTFDPDHSYFPPNPVAGESVFGPLAGTRVWGIPYTDEYQKKYDAYVQEALKGKSRDDFAACVPYGVPRMVGDTPVPFDIIQSPEVMFWYNDYGLTGRRIFLDGRKHPTTPTITGEFGPTYSGHSVGHWEGNTLVIETVDMLGDNFDQTSTPYSPKLHMVERLRLIDTDTLENRMTFTDPVAFTRPWEVTRYYKRTAGFFGAPPAAPAAAPPAGAAAGPVGTRLPRPFINLNDRPCNSNVEMDEDGYQRTILPAEQEARDAAKAKAAAERKNKR